MIPSEIFFLNLELLMMLNVVLQVDSKIVLISAPNKISFLFEVLVELNFHCGFVTVVFV